VRRAAWLLVGSVVLVGVVFVAVFPTRTYLTQRRDLAAAERRVDVLVNQNDQLAARAERLESDAEIERLARQHYNLVRPGEEAFAIITPPPPNPAAVERRAPSRAPWWQRVLTRLTDLF
jgi:cell division protein FtsB